MKRVIKSKSHKKSQNSSKVRYVEIKPPVIKLKSRGPADILITEYIERTTLDMIDNHHRWWCENKVDCLRVKLIKSGQNSVYIQWIEVIPPARPRSGLATRFMKWITSRADDLGIDLTVSLRPMGKFAMPLKDLKRFMNGFGFVGPSDDMKRIFRKPLVLGSKMRIIELGD